MCIKLKPPADKTGGLFLLRSNCQADRAGLVEGHSAFHKHKARERHIQAHFAAAPKFLQHVYAYLFSDLKAIVGDPELNPKSTRQIKSDRKVASYSQMKNA